MNISSCHFSARLFGLFALTATLFLPATALADGTIHGHIIGQDSKGENPHLVPNAKVEFVRSDGTVIASVTSDDNGFYAAENVPAGEFEFHVTADGYRENGNGQTLTLAASTGNHVQDFFLTQGEDQPDPMMGTLRGKVVHMIDGEPQPLHGATIGLQGEDGKARGTYTNANGEYEVRVPPGSWRLSANSAGYEVQFHPAAVSVEQDQETTVDFSFEKESTTVKTTSEVYALVSVQQFDAPQPDRVPEVWFVTRQGTSNAEVPGTVRALTDADLADMGMTPSVSWLWFEAVPAQAIPEGSVHVGARLEPFDSAISETQQVNASESTYFDVTLRKKTPEEIEQEQTIADVDARKLMVNGHIIGQDETGQSMELVTGAVVEFLDDNGLVLGTSKSDENGYYRIGGLRPGKHVYRLSHPKYQNEDAQRSFTLLTDHGIHVHDFFMTVGTETEAPGTLLATAADEDGQQVPGTAVMIWNSEEPDSKKILRAAADRKFRSTLADGTWIVTATAPGHLSTPVAVTVQSGRQATADLVLKKRSGPDSNSSIEALVAVQRFDHMTEAGGVPTVKFVRARDAVEVPGKVSPLSAEDAAAIGGEGGSWEWFIAVPTRSLTVADYFVTGELTNYEPAKSGVQEIDPRSVNSYHITLRSTQTDSPEDELPGTMSGIVQQDRDGTMSPIAGAVVSLHNTSTGAETDLTTDAEGKFGSTTMEPGNWWATVTATGFQRYLHDESIVVKSGAEARADFTLVVRSADDPAPQSYALVAVENAEGAEAAGEPKVQFVNAATGAKVPGKLQSIDQEIPGQQGGSWQWYDAFPSATLPDGQYHVEGHLEGFRDDKSAVKAVAADAETVFNITLRSEELEARPGRLVAIVFMQYANGERGMAENAIVAFKNVADNAVVFAQKDAEGNNWAELPVGRWQVSARVRGLPPSMLPQPVVVAEGRQSVCQLTIVEPPLPEEEMPEMLAFVGVGTPEGSPRPAGLPDVRFVAVRPPGTPEAIGGGGEIPATTKKLAGPALAELGLRPNDLPQGYEWYLAVPSQPINPGVYRATAGLNGFGDVTSAAKAAVPGRATTFDLTIYRIIPEVEFEVVSAANNEPISGVTARFMNVGLGRSLREGFAATTNASGKGKLKLPDGMGKYNVLLTGPDLEPVGRQEMIDQPVNKLRFEIRGTDDPILFTGTVKQEATPIKGAEIVMMPADDRVLGANMQRPIVSDERGAFSRDGVPVGRYHVTVTARDCRPFNGVIELTQKQTTADFVLQPCNKVLEQNLVALLTARDMPTITRHYNAARQADRVAAGPDYAMALVALHLQNLQEADMYLTNAMTGARPESEFWDHAADGRLWLYMDQHDARNVDKAAKLINRLGTQIYSNRGPTDASLETAYVMGVIVGVLKGPWKEEYKNSGVDQVDAAVSQSLQGAHREHYLAGRDEIINEFNNAAQNPPPVENQGQMNPNQQRIDKRIKEILDAIKKIDQQIDRANGQRDAIIAQNKAELDKLQRQLNDLEKKLRPLLAQEKALKQKLAQNKARQRQQGPTEALREEERMLQGQLLILNRKINALERQLNDIDAQRKPLDKQNADAIRRAKQITDELNRTKKKLMDELKKLQNGGNPNQRQGGDVPPNNDKELNFSDYLDFNVNERRDDCLKQLQNGCGGQPLPPVPGLI